MKKSSILLAVLLLLFSNLFSQEVSIKGVNLYIADNTHFKLVDMNLNISDHNLSNPGLYSAGSLILNGDIDFNSTTNPFYAFLDQNGTIYLIGNSNSYINGNLTALMQNLVIDKASGDVFVNTPISLSGNLALNNGLLRNNLDIITIEKDGTTSGGSIASHVVGPMGKTGDALDNAFIFPVGTGNHFRPIGYFNLDGLATITARHVENNPDLGWDTDPFLEGNIVDGREMHRVSRVEYWEMNPDENVTAEITLSWDDDYSQINNYTDLLAAVWNGSAYRNLGGTSYNSVDKTYESFADTDMFGVFTLGSAQIPPLMGDVNNDGLVNVLDVVWVVLHITETTPAGFNFENGDLTASEDVGLGDLTALIDLIMGGAKFPSYLSSEPGHLYLNEGGLASFESDGTLAALAFELVSEELLYAEIELLLETNHRLSFNNETGKGVIYSMNNTLFPEGIFDLMQISGIDISATAWGHAVASNAAHLLVEVITYSTNEETIVSGLTEDNFELTLFPNPGRGDFAISFNLPYSSILKFEVIDERGRAVEVIDNTLYEYGSNKIDIYLANSLNSGLYLLRVIESGKNGVKTSFIHKEKIIVVK